MLLYFIYLIGGLLIGLIIATFFWLNYIHMSTCGTLKHADDNGETYLFLDLDVTPDEIIKRHRVTFMVDKDDIAPHR